MGDVKNYDVKVLVSQLEEMVDWLVSLESAKKFEFGLYVDEKMKLLKAIKVLKNLVSGVEEKVR